MKKAPVNKIIPFSNVDGPGNRTSVFFQGCTFNCMFCHNPETIHLCSNCGECVDGCPAGALSFREESAVPGSVSAAPAASPEFSGDTAPGGARTVVWDPSKCVACDRCIRTCPHDASPRVRFMTVEEVLHEIRRTAPYINGVTFSGGECTLRGEFLIDLIREIKKLGNLTCLLDSNGSLDFSKSKELLDVCDGVMLDVKAVSPEWRERLLSHPGEIVLKNLDYLLHEGKLQEVRTVIFPGRDKDNEETVRYTASKIGNACDYKIIRYRPFGVREKYQAILGEDETEQAYAERYAELARSLGAEKAYVV